MADTATNSAAKGKGKAKAPPATNGETQQNTAPSTGAAAAAAPTELSNAEKKKLAKADKAARRANTKDGSAAGPSNAAQTTLASVNGTAAVGGPSRPIQEQNGPGRRGSMNKSGDPARAAQGGRSQGKGTAAGSQAGKSGGDKTLAVRQRRASQGAGAGMSVETRADSKHVGFFAHLYGQPRRHALEGSAREVHPAVLALGLQLSNYVICGSQARCVAMLLALKSVIRSYTTPHGTSLPRHLSSTYLSPQLTHIKSARPFSTTQSNAIRWLKNLIANIDPSAAEPAAKSAICAAIDAFLRERFTVADRLIADAAAAHVRDGDVVLTYAKSAVVQAALLAAKARGTRFRVVVVDARPLFEGRALARALASSGMEVQYCLTGALGHVVGEATVCFLGAHAVLGNGRVYSRVGTALVAMAARDQGVPVVVCAESIKFTERVALDSVVGNELAPEDELVLDDGESDGGVAGGGGGGGVSGTGTGSTPGSGSDTISTRTPTLRGWRDKENLQLLNLMYDVTPAEYVDIMITEFGSLPPTSAPQVQRMSAVS